MQLTIGDKEILKLVLEQQVMLATNNSLNIFTAALFGKIAIVKSMLEFSPSLINAKGPHGFTLLHHAEKGGDDALAVKDYLMLLGLKETKTALY
jgi:ankyrin repeat protein